MPGVGVQIPHEVVVLSGIVAHRGQRLAARQAYVGQRHVVGARPVEDRGDHAEAAGVDLRHAGLARGVLLQIDAEHSRGSAVQGGERGPAHVGHARVREKLAQRGGRRGAARLASATEIAEPLAHLQQQHIPIAPEALGGEVTPGQILGQRERLRRDSAHVAPVRDPAPSLLGTDDRDGASRATATADPAPESLTAAGVTEDAIDIAQPADGPRARSRDAALAEEDAQRVLVLASLDDRAPGQEEAAGAPAAPSRDGAHVGIAVGNQQVDSLGVDHPAQAVEEAAVLGREHEIVPVGRRLLEHEAIGVTPHDVQGRVGAQAADQIVAGAGAGAQDQQAARHRAANSRSRVVPCQSSLGLRR